MAGEILPLAITMMAGPQILSAVVLVTGKRPVVASVAFVVAVPVAMIVMLLILSSVAGLFDDSLQRDSGPSTAAKAIQVGLVALLIAAAVKAYLGRETAEPPKWLGGLQEASPARAFALGLALLSIFPSDFMILLTTSVYLAGNDLPVTDALPLIAATTLIAALPLIAYTVFRRRAAVAMPKVRDWMNDNSWVVNIAVYVIFVVLILG